MSWPFAADWRPQLGAPGAAGDEGASHADEERSARRDSRRGHIDEGELAVRERLEELFHNKTSNSVNPRGLEQSFTAIIPKRC